MGGFCITKTKYKILQNTKYYRGRVKGLPPHDARFQQKLQEVAEAPRSGGSSKKWRKLDQVGEKRRKKSSLKMIKDKYQKYIYIYTPNHRKN